MLKRLSVLSILLLATACATGPDGPSSNDPAARRAAMQALPTQGSCQPADANGLRACTIRLGSKDVPMTQTANVTTIRYRDADTADPAFVAGLRRVLVTAGTPNLDRAMSVITSHGKSGAMENFTTGCFEDPATTPNVFQRPGPVCNMAVVY